ncbi:uncharacterized protein LOC123025075 [Varanus komodoensis]|uniref:Uncharacterized protein n=1 Tax=Varanus komodoensis TaxID=61221 RepID=A0A8D2JK21_VARKO|nr:uncharacterized protein LOC123025075 [Varanus komodoensis]XP_044289469.1 uncharacterized protein LOC123025075 [Varanus komodoensis]XP_044289470.1 uncharacterized protein LOC123025075 [Varanus komodoensis]
MEEAPKPTLQDELEWCISQLETGLLRLNPTPKQAEETQRILRVLRSRKTSLGKKRQVMHHVFGDYRLKMAEERKRAANPGMRPEMVQIQPEDNLTSGSVVYRRRSSHPSTAAAASWFVPSDNNFQFGFALPEMASEDTHHGTTAEAHEFDDSKEQPVGNGLSETLNFSTGTQSPKFAFNFVIPDDSPEMGAAAEAGCSSQEATVPLERADLLRPDRPPVMNSAGGRDEECSAQAMPKLETPQVALTGSEETPLTVTPGGSSKRRKKKKQKQPPSSVARCDDVNGASQPHSKSTANQAEGRQSEEQTRREVDWCVEQLELGLKTQKSTPKQMEEARRALRTLRSEKAVLAKKRQLMRALFGDYRTKMAEERQKQLKSMLAASKAACITEVTEDAHKKKSQVFRKSAKMAGRAQSSAEPFLCPSVTSACPRAAHTCSSVFAPSQEEFHFNFF